MKGVTRQGTGEICYPNVLYNTGLTVKSSHKTAQVIAKLESSLEVESLEWHPLGVLPSSLQSVSSW